MALWPSRLGRRGSGGLAGVPATFPAQELGSGLYNTRCSSCAAAQLGAAAGCLEPAGLPLGEAAEVSPALPDSCALPACEICCGGSGFGGGAVCAAAAASRAGTGWPTVTICGEALCCGCCADAWPRPGAPGIDCSDSAEQEESEREVAEGQRL